MPSAAKAEDLIYRAEVFGRLDKLTPAVDWVQRHGIGAVSRPAMSTRTKPRSLSQANQRELVRLLDAILEQVYDRTLDPAGGFGIVRRMEGAKMALEAILTPAPSTKITRQAR